jgi:hypoxia up-regulated 1
MWNWSTRLFLTEAHQNLTADEAAGVPPKWTREELASLEKTLKEHERWLGEWVDKQRAVKMNEDPVITTTEMKARAKTLEMQLQKLVKRKVPPASIRSKKEGTTTATPASEGETRAGTETTTTGTTGSSPSAVKHEEL